MPKRQGLKKKMRKRDYTLAAVQSLGTILVAFGLPVVIVYANYGF